jgi:hypothetical protein
VKPEMFILYWDAVFQQFLDPYLDLDPFLFVKTFCSLIVFGGTEVLIFYILICRPERTTYSEVPS